MDYRILKLSVLLHWNVTKASIVQISGLIHMFIQVCKQNWCFSIFCSSFHIYVTAAASSCSSMIVSRFHRRYLTLCMIDSTEIQRVRCKMKYMSMLKVVFTGMSSSVGENDWHTIHYLFKMWFKDDYFFSSNSSILQSPNNIWHTQVFVPWIIPPHQVLWQQSIVFSVKQSEGNLWNDSLLWLVPPIIYAGKQQWAIFLPEKK